MFGFSFTSGVFIRASWGTLEEVSSLILLQQGYILWIVMVKMLVLYHCIWNKRDQIRVISRNVAKGKVPAA